jgi:hypothetical protein
MNDLPRRQFLGVCLGGALELAGRWDAARAGGAAGTPFVTRGVVLVPEDLTLADWPARARAAGLTTIGLHHQNSPQAVVRWIGSDAGQRFCEDCRTLGLRVEYELHAMKELLPRDLFARNPEFFRMNDKGERTPDANCCVHSERGLEIICENALALGKVLRPTTGRYFFWGDDGQAWCGCPRCGELLPSEQALLLENRLCRALRVADPEAQVAHLAYHATLPPPKKVTPAAGVFLEFAPIQRRYDIPYEEQHDPQLAEGLFALEANLKVFPKATAQVLEYWLDVSRFSQWKRPGVKLPWNRDVFRADVATYGKLGIRHITTFAAWLDGPYRDRFGDLSFINEYGAELSAAKRVPAHNEP